MPTLSKNMKVVFNLQEVWDSLNTLPNTVHDQVLCSITFQDPTPQSSEHCIFTNLGVARQSTVG